MLLALFVLLAAIVLFAVQTVFALLGVRIANLFSYWSFDPDGAFAWISVHHIVQGALALVLMGILALAFRLDFKLGLGDKRAGMRIVLWYTVILAAFELVRWFGGNALSDPNLFDYPVNPRNVLGVLGFQLLLSGTSEELLFRALPVTLLLLLTQKTFRLFRRRVQLPLSVIIAGVIFAMAHFSWTTNPFQLHFDVEQLLFAFVLGTIQGWAYVKTGSIVYPMMMHGIYNTLNTGYSIVLPMLFL